MFRRLGTTRRIASYFVLFYTAATLALGLGIYAIGDRALREQIDDRISVEAHYLASVYQKNGLNFLQDTLQRRDDRGVNTLGYLLVDRAGRRQGGELAIERQSPGWAQISFRDEEDEDNVARALTVELFDGGQLTVAMELEPMRALRNTAIWLFLGGLGAMLAGGILGGIFLTRAIRSRLTMMNDTAQAIIAGDMANRVPATTIDDEFGRLARTFNLMLDRNSALIDNLRQISSDIAHDLRTPLARLHQRLERIAEMETVDGRVQDEIEKAIEESNATLSLFAALLRIAEVESGSLRRYFHPFDLSANVRRICESYMAVAEDSGRTLDCEIDDDIEIVGDPELVDQALVNLLENAIRHTPAGTHIRVALGRRDGGIMLAVTDNGSGVPQDQWPALTQRFTRADRSRSTPGFGLGLNLVKAVATVHNAVLEFSDASPGLSARLRFPGA